MKSVILFSLLSSFSYAQVPDRPKTEPTHRVTITLTEAKSVDYRQLRGTARIGFLGTPIMPDASGLARVRRKGGLYRIYAEFERLQPPTTLGPGTLTYVAWAVSPQGRAQNLGEVGRNGGDGWLQAQTDLQAFSLFVTAEPDFAVSQPGDLVVLQNTVGPGSGKVEAFPARYELLTRAPVPVEINPDNAPAPDLKTPLEIQEARLAVHRAAEAHAQDYASSAFDKASLLLQVAEAPKTKKSDRKMAAREATQIAEDARLVALKTEAENMKTALRQTAEQAQGMVAKAEREKEELRDSMADQLNAIAKTVSTPRGLVLTMSDVFFEPGKAELSAPAREKLAQITGVISAHPGMRLSVEGHADSRGSAELNAVLSERRANAVRDFLVSQGIPADSIAARGLGSARPVASNDTPGGRQQNRRVEIVVSEGAASAPR